jgi:uncharacterized protein
MRHGQERHACDAGRWAAAAGGTGDACPALTPGLDVPPAHLEVRRLVEWHRPALAALLEREPGHSLFLAANLAHFSLDASYVRYWGIFAHHQLLAALMLVGRRAMPYAPPGVDIAPLAHLAASEGFDFAVGRADLVGELLATCPPEEVMRHEQHDLAALTLPQLPAPRHAVPSGAVVRRAGPRDVDALIQLYWQTDGFEGLGVDQLRQVLSGRVRALRTYVAELRGRLLSAASTSAEARAAAMIGGVWTAPDVRNRGLGTAVVAALCRDLVAERRRPYLFYQIGNAPAAAVYATVGFQVVGRWTIAYLSNPLPQ